MWTNDRNAILYDCSFNEEVERVLFHPLSSRFLKENLFWWGSCSGRYGHFGPIGALGSQKHVEGVAEVSEEIWRFLKKFCEPTLSNLLPPAQAFSNPATRWRCPALESCNSLLISSLKTFFLNCMSKTRQLNQSWFVFGSMNTLKEICQRMTSPMTACFPVFLYRGLKGHCSDCSTHLRSNCVQVG